METVRGEARWLVVDEAHVPALGSEADSFDYGGQAVLALDAHYTALPPAGLFLRSDRRSLGGSRILETSI
jgi:hypothetical protein